MTSVSAITLTSPLTLNSTASNAATTVPIVSNSTQTATLADSPASVVMLGQETKVANATTYTPRGLLPIGSAVYTWERDVSDKVTQSMTTNILQSSNASRFQGLGASLITQLAAGSTTSVSQSVFRSSAESALDASAVKSSQAQLHGKTENTISLTLKTSSGATITFNLSSDKDGLAVSAEVTEGKLSESERAALAGLADSFQGAIDGLTAQPPRLNLGSLAQLDTDVFTSVDLSARLKVGSDQFQTLSLRADAEGKTVELNGPSGNINVSVNNSNAILGNAQQQAVALQNYLAQFDEAQDRGEGDVNLMKLFKDAFSELQGNPKSLTGNTSSASSLSEVDRAVLSGLADFKASLNQAASYNNPMRPGEAEKFSYQASQSTSVKGNSLNRSVEQNQQSSLTASYHKGLYPGVALALSGDPKTQNYSYYQIEDKASSSIKLGYDKGALVEATSTQKASQSTQVLTYEMGNLISSISTPKELSTSRNLLSMLDAALTKDRSSQQTSGTSTLADTLQGIQRNALLQADPGKIND